MKRGANITERVQDEQKERTHGHTENLKTINPIIAILRDL